MFNISWGELLVVFILAILLIPPKSWPSAAKYSLEILSQIKRLMQMGQYKLEKIIENHEINRETEQK